MNRLLELMGPADPHFDVHGRYDKELNVEAAAALLMSWTDKQRAGAKGVVMMADRDFATIPEEQQKLYKHLMYRLLDALTNRE